MLIAMHSSLTSLHSRPLVSSDFPVRILLDESPNTSVNWLLTCQAGFDVYSSDNRYIQSIEVPHLKVRYVEDYWSLNGYILPQQYLTIIPKRGLLSQGKIEYDGIFSLVISDGQAYLVNTLDLETYISTVLLYESIPSWPDEVQKALSIACRTYALNVILHKRAHASQLPYDLKATVDDQVYRGHERKQSLRHLVAQTKGKILTFEKKPILAMYTAVCGGIIPSRKNSSILNNAPYLKRPYPCIHCKEHTLYRWNQTLLFEDIEQTLDMPELGTITDVTIDAHDKAGVAQKVIIAGTKKTIQMPAQKFRTFFSKIRSICCTFNTKEHALEIAGKGHGHHIGLCQWGAFSMAKKGRSYRDILKFYYPHTTLASLETLNQK